MQRGGTKMQQRRQMWLHSCFAGVLGLDVCCPPCLDLTVASASFSIPLAISERMNGWFGGGDPSLLDFWTVSSKKSKAGPIHTMPSSEPRGELISSLEAAHYSDALKWHRISLKSSFALLSSEVREREREKVVFRFFIFFLRNWIWIAFKPFRAEVLKVVS